MAGELGSVEQVSEGQPRAEQNGAEAKPSRHLYIVHSVDVPRSLRMACASRPMQSKCMLDRSVQAQIGRMLRDVFADVAEEPVPERFIMLLEALEAKEKQP